MNISAAMRKYQLKLADRQCRMSAISLNIQHAIVMLVTSLYARQSGDAITRAAGDTICRELKRSILSTAPTDKDFRQVVQVGADIADNGWQELHDVDGGEIMMPYK